MPSTNSSSIPNVFDSSTVTTPSLPTLSRASARTSPIAGSAAEMAAMFAISSRDSISFAWSLMESTAEVTAFSIPRFNTMGLAPAATFFIPRRTMARASTVAVVVPSPATSLVFVATSLASLLTPASRARRASSLNFSCLTGNETSSHGSGAGRLAPEPPDERNRLLLVDDGQDVASREDQVLLALDLDLGPAVLGVDDAVADLDVDRHPLTLLEPARANRNDLALLGLLLGRIGDHDAGDGRLLLLLGLDDDPVLQRLQVELGHTFLLAVLRGVLRAVSTRPLRVLTGYPRECKGSTAAGEVVEATAEGGPRGTVRWGSVPRGHQGPDLGGTPSRPNPVRSVRSQQVLEVPVPEQEGGGLESRMDLELAEYVLDVCPGRLRTDHQGPGDGVVVGALGQEGQDLSLSVGQPGQSFLSDVELLPVRDEPRQESAEHPRRNHRLTSRHGSRYLQELHEGSSLGEEPAGSSLDGRRERPLVLLSGQDQHPTPGDAFEQ